ncbi:hypothetical protein B0H16DRAFT_1465922 [Mycena metata]|uniref:F-box domain-containing protein n=1 Tax=Mycena metata TaxID=1033252 RepID=A0AAD7I9R1_9AGAR|nr:hypothetical protein B0H16DRAFT_1465922 [Mycena metata]
MVHYAGHNNYGRPFLEVMRLVNGRVRPHRKLAPLLLAQICGQWRAVALQTPQLWRSIHLEYTYASEYDGIPLLFGLPGPKAVEDKSSALLDLWFSRAGGHSLSISLICVEDNLYPPGLLPAIFAHLARWRRLELAMPVADFVEFNKVKGPFPSLRSLSIQITDSDEPFFDIAINAMLNSPRLVALHLLDQYGQKAESNGRAALPQTTTLQVLLPWIAESSFDSHAKLFAHLPHLIHLGTSSVSYSRSDTSTLTPHLRSLIVGFPEHLEFFGVPNLEHLEVPLWEAQNSGSVQRLTRFFIYRFGPRRLTSLVLELAHVRDNDFLACLSTVPSLVTLQLIFYAAGREGTFFAAHCHMLQDPALLPSLRNLILTDAVSMPAYGPFLALVYQRKTLKHAELHISSGHGDVRRATGPPGAEHLAELTVLVARGLTVRVTTPNYAWPVDAIYCDPWVIWLDATCTDSIHRNSAASDARRMGPGNWEEFTRSSGALPGSEVMRECVRAKSRKFPRMLCKD